MSTNATVTDDNHIAIARVSHYDAGRILGILTMLPLFTALIAAVSWLCWILASGVLGTRYAALAVLVLGVGAAGFSWRTGRSFAGSLIMFGFTGVMLLTAALYGLAGYTLIFHGWGG